MTGPDSHRSGLWPRRRTAQDGGACWPASPTRASPTGAVLAGCAFAYLWVLLFVHLPEEVLDPASASFILLIGAVGIWRYSWWAVHALRAVVFRRLVFPRLRAAADRTAERPDHLYVLVCSYRVEPQVSYRVYDALVKEAVAYGVPTTIFAAVGDRVDVDVLDQVLADNGDPASIEIDYMYQSGAGKRAAMAEVLRAIARRMPGPKSVLALLDGDVQLTPGALRRTVPFLLIRPELGAVTTDNRAIVRGDDWAREWYELRHTQRHMLMSSLALSRRLLVLTGRFSVFRAELAAEPGFIEIVGRDSIEHWRLGRIELLSGDDKSTWYYLLRQGWKMLYVPDVAVHAYEALPRPDAFVGSTLQLMRRWYGNMLRASGRAIALGPRRIGGFPWWCLIDQRISMWTTLLGPSLALLLSLFVRPSFAIVYLLWVMSTRLVASLLLGLSRGRFSPIWPPLLYFSQITGALVKIYVSFRLNQQEWVRQGIAAGGPADPRLLARQRRQNAYLHALSGTAFLAVLVYGTGLLDLPSRGTLIALRSAGGLTAPRIETANTMPDRGQRLAAPAPEAADRRWSGVRAQPTVSDPSYAGRHTDPHDVIAALAAHRMAAVRPLEQAKED